MKTESITIDKAKLRALRAIVLTSGAGEDLEHACVMQAVDYVTSGGLSDDPACACPALTSYAIRVNDYILARTNGAEHKMYSEKLKKLIPKLVGTRDDKTRDRANFLVHNSITVILPILTDALKLTDDSKELRKFKLGEWKEMRAFCEGLKPRLREAMKKKLSAAYSSAADAAANAAANAAASAASANYANYANYAAYAAAYAASAADAAASAAYAAAYAASASASAKKFWLGARTEIWAAQIKALENACSIGRSK